MIQGTTPTHYFELPFHTNIIDKLHIIYAQDDQIIFTKTKSDCDFDEQTISVKLTQEDTLSLDHLKPVEIQLRILTFDDTAICSVKMKVGVAQCLETEVLI